MSRRKVLEFQVVTSGWMIVEDKGTTKGPPSFMPSERWPRIGRALSATPLHYLKEFMTDALVVKPCLMAQHDSSNQNDPIKYRHQLCLFKVIT